MRSSEDERFVRFKQLNTMSKESQTSRLTRQHKRSKGAIGIFGREAKAHDAEVLAVARAVVESLRREFPNLQFRHRKSVGKKEINAALRKIDIELGQTLFLVDANIKPDGGVVEVLDDNAIERAHKNISEIANFMLAESHFPYVLFLEGSNFLTQDVKVTRPDGREVVLRYDSGELNRLDRLTAANYGMPINTNLCKNKFIQHEDASVMLQAASIYTQGSGMGWDESDMTRIMLDISRTSLQMLGRDLFKQLSGGKRGLA